MQFYRHNNNNLLTLTLLIIISFVTLTICGTNDEIKPFSVNVPENDLIALKERLKSTRFPITNVQGTAWKTGGDTIFLKKLVDYWLNTYDWRKQEKQFNEMPQYTTSIDGRNVHFVHARSPHPRAQPLIFVHGWPGSVLECYKILPMLTTPEKYGGNASDAFHVVCPSIPGYGFSEAPNTEGFDVVEAARTFIKLMAKLGYNKYWAQGGDWGGIITACMALEDQQNMIGLHTNFPFAGGSLPFRQRGFFAFFRSVFTFLFPTWLLDSGDLAEWDRFSIVDTLRQTGYFHLQSTKPDSISFALSDSPVGLLAYITEKFHAWSDHRNHTFGEHCSSPNQSPQLCISKDDIITNVMLYWIPNHIGPSIRFYYEFFHSSNKPLGDKFVFPFVPVPSAVAVFPVEIGSPRLRFGIEYAYNLHQFSRYDVGGHFAALEQPVLLVKDIWKFRRDLTEKISEKKEL